VVSSTRHCPSWRAARWERAVPRPLQTPWNESAISWSIP
jgi:hypothetical protein